ncbi:MAG TPA: 4Fe-4S dicluster domain-containing protein [Thermomicrobiales bacterium]|nr:4Fe-4S dicluster domain-containing protein [Thermomicrobiales bacterium]
MQRDEGEAAAMMLDARRPVGFFTDTSLCIGCKACEVACKQWNQLPSDGYEFTGFSYDNTRMLSATTWRHVAFVEEPGAGAPGAQHFWLMLSDVCKHCSNAGCLQACPTGAIVRTEFGTVYVQQDVCNGCGYCVPACPYGVIELSPLDHQAHKCTLCYDRLKVGEEPACAKACPTDSIQFGPLDELRDHAHRRLRDLHDRGVAAARLYGLDEGAAKGTAGEGTLGAFFLLLDEPEHYNLPARVELPQNTVAASSVLTALTGLLLGLGAALAFRRR